MHSHSEEGPAASSWGGGLCRSGGFAWGLETVPGSLAPCPVCPLPASCSPVPLRAEAAQPDQREPQACVQQSRALTLGVVSPTRGPSSGLASPLPPLEPCFLPCVGVHLPEAESPRCWGLGAGGRAAPRGEVALTRPAPTDPQPQPQRHLPDELPGRVQGDGGPGCVPEAGQVPGGHHVHRGRGRAEGERHLLGHVHAPVW